MLSKKVWIIVGAVVIIVLLVIVFMTYFGQIREQEELNNRLTQAENRQTTLAAEEEDLENRLAQARSLVDASQVQYPQAIQSIEYGEYIFEIAEKCNLRLSTLTFPRPSAVKQGSVTYSMVSLSLPVSGALEDIFEFIDVIRTDPRFASTRVKSVNLSGGSATIAVDIYGYGR